MTHTPGPWTVSDRFYIYDAAGHEPALAAVRGDPRSLNRNSEADANALLIASAPELLAALRDLYKSCQNWAPTIDRSRAEHAIKKAQGGVL